MSDSLVVYLQATVNHLTWNLGSEPKFSAKQQVLLVTESFLQPQQFLNGFPIKFKKNYLLTYQNVEKYILLFMAQIPLV